MIVQGWETDLHTLVLSLSQKLLNSTSMGLIENLLAGAAGYAVGEMSRSHTLRDAIDERINRSKQKVTLEDIIDEYARQHCIYTQDNKLAHRLHQIATRYEEYDYEDLYDRR
jgi:FKBP-type peptidyl-prolyl cis-trans isomerase (trigger factor)